MYIRVYYYLSQSILRTVSYNVTYAFLKKFIYNCNENYVGLKMLLCIIKYILVSKDYVQLLGINF